MFKWLGTLLVASAAGAVFISGQVRADTAADSEAVSGDLQEVVVTARKTAENIEDVPLSIRAFDTKALADQGIVGLKDIAERTPGFVYQEYSTSFNASPTIRGLTQFDITSPVANVATIVDGVYVPRNYSVDLGIADVSQVAIVKGPQSALYGGNAFAGVIGYTLTEPTVEPHAEVGLTAGTNGRFDYRFAGSGSVLDGKLQGRAYYARSEYDGTWHNDYPAATGGAPDVGGHDNETFGAALKFKPTSGIEADLNYFRLNRHEDVKPSYNVASSDASNKFNCSGGLLICGTLSTNPATYQSAISTRPAGIVQPDQPGFTSSTDFLDAQLKVELAENLNATYLFGHVRSFATEITSTSVNPATGSNISYAAFLTGGFAIAPLTNDQKEGGANELNSHELRVDYSIDHFKFLAGLYYAYDVDNYQFNIWQVPDGTAIGGNASNPFDFSAFPFALQGHHLVTNTTAEFARVGYSFLDDQATIGAEVRHSSDTLKNEDTIAKFEQGATFNETTPRFTADYKIDTHSLLYASAAKGVKEGGFNGLTGASGLFNLLPSQQTFQPESNWTYELGTKNTLWGGRAVINADVFLVKWSDLQITEQPLNTPAALATVTSVITTNLGAATSKGIESDGTFAATPHLDLNYALAVLDPTFNRGTVSQRFAGFCNGSVCPADNSVAGNTLPRTSKVQASGGTTWKDTIFGSYQWNIHADLTYQSYQDADEMNLAKIPSRLLVNASAGIRGSNWDLTLWGKNVFDKHYVADSLFILVGGASSYGVSLGELATAGVTLNAHY